MLPVGPTEAVQGPLGDAGELVTRYPVILTPVASASSGRFGSVHPTVTPPVGVAVWNVVRLVTLAGAIGSGRELWTEAR